MDEKLSNALTYQREFSDTLVFDDGTILPCVPKEAVAEINRLRRLVKELEVEIQELKKNM